MRGPCPPARPQTRRRKDAPHLPPDHLRPDHPHLRPDRFRPDRFRPELIVTGATGPVGAQGYSTRPPDLRQDRRYRVRHKHPRDHKHPQRHPVVDHRHRVGARHRHRCTPHPPHRLHDDHPHRHDDRPDRHDDRPDRHDDQSDRHGDRLQGSVPVPKPGWRLGWVVGVGGLRTGGPRWELRRGSRCIDILSP